MRVDGAKSETVTNCTDEVLVDGAESETVTNCTDGVLGVRAKSETVTIFIDVVVVGGDHETHTVWITSTV